MFYRLNLKYYSTGLLIYEKLGVAQIIVEDSGQNSIVIVSGANNHLTPDDVQASREILSKSKIMLTVMEIPRQTVLAGLKLASELGGKSIQPAFFFNFSAN